MNGDSLWVFYSRYWLKKWVWLTADMILRIDSVRNWGFGGACLSHFSFAKEGVSGRLDTPPVDQINATYENQDSV